MKKQVLIGVSILVILCFAWAAFAQPQGGGQGGGGGMRGFGMNREAQTKAIAAMQEQLGKLKAMLEQAPGARGNFQDMTDEERTKMREERTKRQEEQANLLAAMQDQLDTIRGGMQVVREYTASMTPLKEALASAEKEKATATAAMLKTIIAEKEKAFQAKATAMDLTPEQIERYQQMRGRGMGGGRGQQ